MQILQRTPRNISSKVKRNLRILVVPEPFHMIINRSVHKSVQLLWVPDFIKPQFHVNWLLALYFALYIYFFSFLILQN